MNKYAKFATLMAIIVGVLIWLATANVSESQTYYKTISELNQMPDQGKEKKLRVGGDVEKGSILRKADKVEFTLAQDNLHLRVAYNGRDPLPDTFKDGAQALADGRMGSDGVFHANKIQAKCSSKYQAKPGEAPAGLKVAPAAKKSI
ncbi:MAG: cytochrome c maturation protein CcmE [Acidobacteriota bacterium]|nr:cytochrome c maturation protein CcmE [Acidobacteriota bacterium]